MTTTQAAGQAPVRKSITVRASVEHAFRVFTAGIDTWWPRTHHVGKTPMTKNIVEGRAGGRCYSTHTDGTECDWGTVLEWEPPSRFVMAWQLGPTWQYEPEIEKSSEVEVRFTRLETGLTRVDLEHRHIERHGAGADALRTQLDGPDAWMGILRLFGAEAARGQQ